MRIRNVLLCSVAAAAMAASAIYAQAPAPAGKPPAAIEGKAGKGEKMAAPKSRQEAIDRAKGRLTELEGMTDEQWNKRQQEREQRRADWKEKRKDRLQQGGKIPEPKTDKPK